MAWHEGLQCHAAAALDGLDIPLVAQTDQGFFEFDRAQVTAPGAPEGSNSERLWGGPGRTPVSALGARSQSPLMAYRRVHPDAALDAQLELAGEEVAGTLVEPGHAAVRFTNQTTGGNALTTMRTEMHRLAEGTHTARTRTAASSVWQVFDRGGTVTMDGQARTLEHGDVFAAPAWTEFSLQASDRLDLFTFSEAPVFEKLHLLRTAVSA